MAEDEGMGADPARARAEGDAAGRPATGAGGRLAVEPFGQVEGRPASLYTLSGADGMVARITDYGGILVGLEVPDARGEVRDVVLGLDALEGPASRAYRSAHPYFGALVGRVANRISSARFTLDGEEHALSPNDPPNNIHGGRRGFDKRLWAAQALDRPEGPELALSLTSADGEEGFPGNLNALAHYRLRAGGVLRLDLWATCDRATPVSLTSHSYFNLAGEGVGDVLEHRLTVFAEVHTPLDAALLPTGELRHVEGTPFDFRRAKALGADIDDAALRKARGRGYDANFVVAGEAGRLRPAARLAEPASGRVMELWTTQPALQLYTGNYLDGSWIGKAGVAYGPHAGIALEPQAYPDAVNVPHFPSCVLRPGQVYHETIEYRFSTGAAEERDGRP